MRRATGLFAASMVLTAVTWHSPVRAEYWVDSMGDLLSTATHVEIVRIDAVTANGVEATVKTQIRGDKPGSRIQFFGFFDVTPAVGDEVLHICDSSECPRAIGIDRGGYFEVHAQQPGDGASVLPNIVERTSLVALTQGKTAPDICVDVDVSFLDGTGSAAAGSFTASFDPTDGSGTAKGAVFGAKQTRKASLSTPFSLHASSQHAVSINVHGDTQSVTFTGNGLIKQKSGCYGLHAMAAHPLARTEHELETALDGTPARRVIATGAIAVPGGTRISTGTYDIEIAVTTDGQLEVTSSIMAGTQLRLTEIEPNHMRIGFAHGANGMYPLIAFDVGAPAALRPAAGLPAQLATLFSAGTTSLPVTWHDPSNGDRHLPVGAAAMTYVPAKK